MRYGRGHSIYFLGIGGIGMSALARYFMRQGCAVAGYDRTPSPLTVQLEQEGMAIHYDDSPSALPADIDLVVYTPAVPRSLKEYVVLAERKVPMKKRAEVLGLLSQEHFTIAIAGTHGKTTTTAMVSHILRENGVDFTAFIGGIANNFGSNLFIGSGNEEVLVVEADEYDRSFLHLHPDVSVVTSIDADHLDIYGDKDSLLAGFRSFVELTDSQGTVVMRDDLELSLERPVVTFGFGNAAEVKIEEVTSVGALSRFNIICGEASYAVTLPSVGRHNMLNAAAAFAVGMALNLDAHAVAAALASFSGVHRRFDIRVSNDSHCYVDDYAHHPVEIESCLMAARKAFPDKKMTVIFQPHLFSRTRDFMDDFARSLELADTLLLLDIYPARELPLPGIDAEALLQRVRLADKQCCSKDGVLSVVDSLRPELLITIGAGDIDRMVPLIEKMMSTW